MASNSVDYIIRILPDTTEYKKLMAGDLLKPRELQKLRSQMSALFGDIEAEATRIGKAVTQNLSSGRPVEFGVDTTKLKEAMEFAEGFFDKMNAGQNVMSDWAKQGGKMYEKFTEMRNSIGSLAQNIAVLQTGLNTLTASFNEFKSTYQSFNPAQFAGVAQDLGKIAKGGKETVSVMTDLNKAYDATVTKSKHTRDQLKEIFELIRGEELSFEYNTDDLEQEFKDVLGFLDEAEKRIKKYAEKVNTSPMDATARKSLNEAKDSAVEYSLVLMDIDEQITATGKKSLFGSKTTHRTADELQKTILSIFKDLASDENVFSDRFNKDLKRASVLVDEFQKDLKKALDKVTKIQLDLTLPEYKTFVPRVNDFVKQLNSVSSSFDKIKIEPEIINPSTIRPVKLVGVVEEVKTSEETNGAENDVVEQNLEQKLARMEQVKTDILREITALKAAQKEQQDTYDALKAQHEQRDNPQDSSFSRQMNQIDPIIKKYGEAIDYYQTLVDTMEKDTAAAETITNDWYKNNIKFATIGARQARVLASTQEWRAKMIKLMSISGSELVFDFKGVNPGKDLYEEIDQYFENHPVNIAINTKGLAEQVKNVLDKEGISIGGGGGVATIDPRTLGPMIGSIVNSVLTGAPMPSFEQSIPEPEQEPEVVVEEKDESYDYEVERAKAEIALQRAIKERAKAEAEARDATNASAQEAAAFARATKELTGAVISADAAKKAESIYGKKGMLDSRAAAIDAQNLAAATIKRASTEIHTPDVYGALLFDEIDAKERLVAAQQAETQARERLAEIMANAPAQEKKYVKTIDEVPAHVDKLVSTLIDFADLTKEKSIINNDGTTTIKKPTKGAAAVASWLEGKGIKWSEITGAHSKEQETLIKQMLQDALFTQAKDGSASGAAFADAFDQLIKRSGINTTKGKGKNINLLFEDFKEVLDMSQIQQMGYDEWIKKQLSMSVANDAIGAGRASIAMNSVRGKKIPSVHSIQKAIDLVALQGMDTDALEQLKIAREELGDSKDEEAIAKFKEYHNAFKAETKGIVEALNLIFGDFKGQVTIKNRQHPIKELYDIMHLPKGDITGAEVYNYLESKAFDKSMVGSSARREKNWRKALREEQRMIWGQAQASERAPYLTAMPPSFLSNTSSILDNEIHVDEFRPKSEIAADAVEVDVDNAIADASQKIKKNQAELQKGEAKLAELNANLVRLEQKVSDAERRASEVAVSVSEIDTKDVEKRISSLDLLKSIVEPVTKSDEARQEAQRVVDAFKSGDKEIHSNNKDVFGMAKALRAAAIGNDSAQADKIVEQLLGLHQDIPMPDVIKSFLLLQSKADKLASEIDAYSAKDMLSDDDKKAKERKEKELAEVNKDLDKTGLVPYKDAAKIYGEINDIVQERYKLQRQLAFIDGMTVDDAKQRLKDWKGSAEYKKILEDYVSDPTKTRGALAGSIESLTEQKSSKQGLLTEWAKSEASRMPEAKAEIDNAVKEIRGQFEKQIKDLYKEAKQIASQLKDKSLSEDVRNTLVGRLQNILTSFKNTETEYDALTNKHGGKKQILTEKQSNDIAGLIKSYVYEHDDVAGARATALTSAKNDVETEKYHIQRIKNEQARLTTEKEGHNLLLQRLKTYKKLLALEEKEKILVAEIQSLTADGSDVKGIEDKKQDLEKTRSLISGSKTKSNNLLEQYRQKVLSDMGYDDLKFDEKQLQDNIASLKKTGKNPKLLSSLTKDLQAIQSRIASVEGFVNSFDTVISGTEAKFTPEEEIQKHAINAAKQYQQNIIDLTAQKHAADYRIKDIDNRKDDIKEWKLGAGEGRRYLDNTKNDLINEFMSRAYSESEIQQMVEDARKNGASDSDIQQIVKKANSRGYVDSAVQKLREKALANIAESEQESRELFAQKVQEAMLFNGLNPADQAQTDKFLSTKYGKQLSDKFATEVDTNTQNIWAQFEEYKKDLKDRLLKEFIDSFKVDKKGVLSATFKTKTEDGKWVDDTRTVNVLQNLLDKLDVEKQDIKKKHKVKEIESKIEFAEKQKQAAMDSVGLTEEQLLSSDVVKEQIDLRNRKFEAEERLKKQREELNDLENGALEGDKKAIKSAKNKVAATNEEIARYDVLIANRDKLIALNAKEKEGVELSAEERRLKATESLIRLQGELEKSNQRVITLEQQYDEAKGTDKAAEALRKLNKEKENQLRLGKAVTGLERSVGYWTKQAGKVEEAEVVGGEGGTTQITGGVLGAITNVIKESLSGITNDIEIDTSDLAKEETLGIVKATLDAILALLGGDGDWEPEEEQQDVGQSRNKKSLGYQDAITIVRNAIGKFDMRSSKATKAEKYNSFGQEVKDAANVLLQAKKGVTREGAALLEKMKKLRAAAKTQGEETTTDTKDNKQSTNTPQNKMDVILQKIESMGNRLIALENDDDQDSQEERKILEEQLAALKEMVSEDTAPTTNEDDKQIQTNNTLTKGSAQGGLIGLMRTHLAQESTLKKVVIELSKIAKNNAMSGKPNSAQGLLESFRRMLESDKWEQKERMAYLDLSTGAMSNIITGDKDRIAPTRSKTLRDAYSNMDMNAKVHTHAGEDDPYFSKTDFEQAGIDFGRGIKTQILLSDNNMTVLDMKDVKDGDKDGLLNAMSNTEQNYEALAATASKFGAKYLSKSFEELIQSPMQFVKMLGIKGVESKLNESETKSKANESLYAQDAKEAASVIQKSTGESILKTAERYGAELRNITETTDSKGNKKWTVDLANKYEKEMIATNKRIAEENLKGQFGGQTDARKAYNSYLKTYEELQAKIQEFKGATDDQKSGLQADIDKLQPKLDKLEEKLISLIKRKDKFLGDKTAVAMFNKTQLGTTGDSLRALMQQRHGGNIGMGENIATRGLSETENGSKLIFDVLKDGQISSYALEVDRVTGQVKEFMLAESALANAFLNVNKAMQLNETVIADIASVTGLGEEEMKQWLATANSPELRAYNQAMKEMQEYTQYLWTDKKGNANQEELQHLMALSERTIQLGKNAQKASLDFQKLFIASDPSDVFSANIDLNGGDRNKAVRDNLEEIAKGRASGQNKKYDFMNFDNDKLRFKLTDMAGNIEQVELRWSELYKVAIVSSDKSVAALDPLVQKIEDYKQKISDAKNAGYLVKGSDQKFNEALQEIEALVQSGTASFAELEKARNRALGIGAGLDQAIASNKRKVGTNAVNSVKAQYDKIIGSRDEDLGISNDSALVVEYNNAYNALLKTYNEYVKTNRLNNPEIQKELRQQAAGVQKLGRELLKSTNEAERLQEAVKNSGSFVNKQGDLVELGDFHKFSKDEMENKVAAMRTYAETLYGAEAASFKLNTRTMTLEGTLRENDYIVHDVAVKYNEAAQGAYAFEKAEREHLSGFPAFMKGLKEKTKAIAQYLMSMTSIYRVIGEVRKGIQYIREIDSALTELKKVTDETEETYDKFLDTASKTAAKVGSTIKDVVSSTADWARLGSVLAKLTPGPLYSNV